MPRDELAHRIRARHAAVAERWQARRPAALQLTREVVPGVFQVRTRGSRAYLVVDDGVTVIDSGGPGQGERVLTALREVGRSADDVRHVLLTHAHIDHVGGLPELQRHVPARTAIHLAEAPLVTAVEPLPNPAVHRWVARMLEPYLAWADPGAARIDEVLSDGDELPVMGGLRVVHAPGHTPGSVSFHFPARGILIVGDAIQHKFGRLLPPSRVFSQDMDEAARSIAKLAQLDFETLCFSHFRPILRDGSRRLREFAATFDTTVVTDAAG